MATRVKAMRQDGDDNDGGSYHHEKYPTDR
jgi:hypothetical protein